MPELSPSATCAALPSSIEVAVPLGGRVVVVSDLHLSAEPGPSEVAAVAELTQAIESWTGPGYLLLNGNTLEPVSVAEGAPGLPATDAAAPTGATDAAPCPSSADGGLTAGVSADVGPRSTVPTLQAHPRLVRALLAFGRGPGRGVLLIPGDRDAHLAWSSPCRSALAGQLGVSMALAVDLCVETGAGIRRVHVEPGHRLDPLAALADPTNPGESPLGRHLRQELFPAVRRAEADHRRSHDDWLAGMEHLDDPAAFPRFLASRLAYRKLGRRAWLLLVPVLAAVTLRLPGLVLSHATGLAHGASTRVVFLVVATAVELVLLGALAVASVRRTWRALASLSLGEAGREPNRAGRDLARRLVTEGEAGVITGHTCRPELTDLGNGFYANAGCAGEVVSEVPARPGGLGLPPVFMASRQVSWVEVEAGSELHVRLFHARQAVGGESLVERLVLERRQETAAAKELRPQLVASFPHGVSWPTQPSGLLRKRRIRRLAALFVGLAGFVSVISAMSEPLRDRLADIRAIFPIAVPETAAALAAVAGVALLVLARGVRRGQRRAWFVTEILLAASVVLHLVKGVDVEEALVALTVFAFLWVNRSLFEASTDTPPLQGGLLVWAGAAATTVVAGTIAIKVGAAIDHAADRSLHRHVVGRRFNISWARAFQATVERMIGITHVRLPHAVDRFFSPAMATTTIALVLALAVLLFRPVVARRRRQGQAAQPSLTRARAVFDRYGSGTLDYFALRPDKEFWFWGETVVAYAVYGGVCLVSPDPIGPVAEREPAWRAFRAYVDEHGWALGGLGAGEEWLPVYRATGMHDLYVGDEGVVRTERFTLDGGRFKGLRQAVNRIAKRGYTISFHDPSTLDGDLRSALEEVMTKSRRGDVERGFSMTLGRVFEPDDRGLLLAVVHGPPPEGAPEGTVGAPVAFCHYVPAPGIGGYSLDLMRRDDGEHPNGLIDFAVVETIKYLRQRGGRGLGLNFATMRAVLAGEAGEGPVQRVQAWLLRRMGDSMQIESLWKFNAKFDPDWQPRYVVYDAPENSLAVAVAIARAESFWELPVIGRFLVPAPAAADDVATVRRAAEVTNA
jgi:lysylphosphatidylglycerol synthetase-like protein (DUF2156 family)